MSEGLARNIIASVVLLLIVFTGACQVNDERRNMHIREMAKMGLCAKPIPGNTTWYTWGACQ